MKIHITISCGAVPLAVYFCVVVVWRTYRGGLVPRVFTERSEEPLVTLNLCVMMMRRYHLGEGDLLFTSPASFSRRATARRK